MLTAKPLAPHSGHRQAIRAAYLADEDRLTHTLSQPPLFNAGQNQYIRQQASALITAHRQFEQRSGALDALLHEYALSSNEGLALMSLAESLLRVPDAATADELISDKLANADWQAHLGQSPHPLVNASAWALLLTGKLLEPSHDSLHAPLKAALRKLGQPTVRQVLRFTMGVLGEHFVLGNRIESALRNAQRSPRYHYSFDMLGEGARTSDDAERYYQRYAEAIEAIGKIANSNSPQTANGVSIKLSALHPRFELSRTDSLHTELLPRLRQLALRALHWNIGLTIDAEESWRLEPTLDVFEWLWHDPALQHWNGLSLAVQAYQKRALPVLDWALNLADESGKRIGVRLVKGAYWDSEIKAAQELGLSDYPVFTRKPATDLNYLHGAQRLLQARSLCFPQFATHNAHTIAAVLALAKNTEGFEFQRLHGMGEAIYNDLLEDSTLQCRVYAPVGEHQQLLPYLVRRLLENGANSSFVNQLAQHKVTSDQLTADPRETLQTAVSELPQPSALYGASRVNAQGFSLSDPEYLAHLETDFQRIRARTRETGDGSITVHNPACRSDIIGRLNYDTPERMLAKLSKLDAGFSSWAQQSLSRRAETLLKLADALESHRSELMWLCVKEAGKTLPDALAEVREAVDFCRYYAVQCRELPTGTQGLGVVLSVSPWNFPLAILTGQICGALAAGNTVLAKPAEQTCLIAHKLLNLMRDCSLDDAIVNMVFASGKPAGDTLLRDARVRAVMFTGSCSTAHAINQQLASRPDAPIPLTAETGGVNAMIVDSSALHEQAIDDILESAFYSAGQRCSALRVLYLQNDIAAPFIRQLCGAMAELRVGDPACLDTDVGPVMGESAQQALKSHVQQLQENGTAELIYTSPLAAECSQGTFFAPQLWAIDRIAQLPGEVFGPVLHVISYASDHLDDVVASINAAGYGLTFGIHSRIQHKAQRLAQAVNAGNVYINRNMVGAVVGVQPFGGRGLSGTGPKAGGPLMLRRLSRFPQQAPPILDEKTIAFSGIRETLHSALSNAPLAFNKTFATRLLIDAEDLLGRTHELPGPTGERNQLLYEAAGHFVAAFTEEDSVEDALLTAIAILACDNTLDLHLPPTWKSQFAWLGFARLDVAALNLTTKALQADELAQSTPLAGVVVSQANTRRTTLARRLAETAAQHNTALCPLLTEPVGQVSVYPFVKEKTITENTAALGGNAALLTASS